MNRTHITLDQWQALIAVVDHGSYARAAEALRKSQSALTYAIQKLEHAAGVAVLKREGRRAALTEAGKVLVRRARAVVDEAAGLERVAASLARGQEAEVRVAAEIIFPTELLLSAFGDAYSEYPDTRIELHEHVLSGTEDAIVQGEVDLAIASNIPPGFLGERLMQMRFIPVAAPTHPLNRLGRDATEQELRQHRQLVVRDSGLYRRRTTLVVDAKHRLTVTGMNTAIRAISRGLGFAWLPEEMIRGELDRQAVARIPVRGNPEKTAQLALVYTDRDHAGPVTRHLAESLKRRVADRTGGASES